MQIVITMAGLGTRFKKAGYDMPKYEITAHGRTLFSWSMESLKAFADKGSWYFIVRREDDAADFIRKEASSFADPSNIKVIEIDHATDGQATTALLAAPYWRGDDPLMIYNIDTYVKAGSMRPEDIRGDGFIPCFNAPGDHWSFVATDSNGLATEVREKQRISDNCTLGAYYFSSCSLYERMYKEYYSTGDNLEKGEKYVAPLYNHMISLGMKVSISLIDEKDVHVLGTPEELEQFKNTGL
ncbi:MAG: glycosyltransferase family 2 protein [Lachnospiraceae bacterium]|nr:glycosyltransferase family 2 protein [Lachnospiraceae bacterium]MBQ6575926.1 glycosyltransferase family 2 protein [Lachnospiraceae bacterium]